MTTGTPLRVVGGTTAAPDSFCSPQAVAAIGARLAAQRDVLGLRTVESLRAEISDYRLADDRVISDVRELMGRHHDLLVDTLTSGRDLGDEDFVYARAEGSRRAHQRISLEALGRAARVWGRISWDAVVEQTPAAEPAEREAALAVSGVIMHHVDRVSANLAAGYRQEMQAVSGRRDVLAPDLLDALIAGDAGFVRARRIAPRLGEDYIVVIARRDRQVVDEPWRPMIEAAQTQMGALVGTRHGEVIALCAVGETSDIEEIHRRAALLATAFAEAEVCIGIGGFHPTLAGVASSYIEAHEAVEIATGMGLCGRALRFDDVVIDHVLHSSPHAERIFESSIRALVDYDEERRAELVPTLRAFVTNSLSVARTARVLSVHPNTVSYRLRRIRELSARDPQDADDLLFILLSLKLMESRTTGGRLSHGLPHKAGRRR